MRLDRQDTVLKTNRQVHNCALAVGWYLNFILQTAEHALPINCAYLNNYNTQEHKSLPKASEGVTYYVFIIIIVDCSYAASISLQGECVISLLSLVRQSPRRRDSTRLSQRVE